MKDFFIKYKEYFITALCFAVSILVLMLLRIPCPIKHLTGLSCAGCGMTRALLSAITLDFDAAFMYHPLWVALVPIATVLFIFKAKNKKAAFNICLWLSVALFLSVWIYRTITDDVVVAFDFEGSAVNRVIQKLTELFG